MLGRVLNRFGWRLVNLGPFGQLFIDVAGHSGAPAKVPRFATWSEVGERFVKLGTVEMIYTPRRLAKP